MEYPFNLRLSSCSTCSIEWISACGYHAGRFFPVPFSDARWPGWAAETRVKDCYGRGHRAVLVDDFPEPFWVASASEDYRNRGRVGTGSVRHSYIGSHRGIDS